MRSPKGSYATESLSSKIGKLANPILLLCPVMSQSGMTITP